MLPTCLPGCAAALGRGILEVSENTSAPTTRRLRVSFPPSLISGPPPKRQRTGAVQDLADFQASCDSRSVLDCGSPPLFLREAEGKFFPRCPFQVRHQSARGLAQSKTWRTSKHPVTREASWTAVALRFSFGRLRVSFSPVAHFRSATKAPEGWRSPRPGGLPSIL